MRGVSFVAAAFAAGCADDGAHFATRFASDFAPSRDSVSVVGVFRDGRMSVEAWEQVLLPQLSQFLGATRCDAAYGSTLLAANQTMSSAIDDYARADGPADALLALLAPAAKADLIAVFTISGQLPTPGKQADAGALPSTPMRAMGGGRRGGGWARGRTGRAAAPTDDKERSTLEMSVFLYSVHQRRSVGLIAMQYDGPSFDEALRQFAQKLSAVMPGTTCLGWNWEVPIDPQRIRDAIDQ